MLLQIKILIFVTRCLVQLFFMNFIKTLKILLNSISDKLSDFLVIN